MTAIETIERLREVNLDLLRDLNNALARINELETIIRELHAKAQAIISRK